MDEKKYNGWLVSDSLVKRTVAVYCHYLLGNLLVAIVFILLLIMLGFAEGLLGLA